MNKNFLVYLVFLAAVFSFRSFAGQKCFLLVAENGNLARAKELIRAYGTPSQNRMLTALDTSVTPPTSFAALGRSVSPAISGGAARSSFNELSRFIASLDRTLFARDRIPPSWLSVFLNERSASLARRALMNDETPSAAELGFENTQQSSKALEDANSVMRMVEIWMSLTDEEKGLLSDPTKLVEIDPWQRIERASRTRAISDFFLSSDNLESNSDAKGVISRWREGRLRESVYGISRSMEKIISLRSPKSVP